MGYPGYPRQGPAPNHAGPGMAVTAGIAGLGVGGVLLTQTIMLMSDLSEVPELPTGWLVMNVAHVVIAAFAVLGAILVFVRQLAGAFVLMIAALSTIAVLLIAPALAEDVFFTMLGSSPDFAPSGHYGNYVKALFEFGNEQAVLRFAALALGVLLLITAVLPPALNWLRGPHRTHPHGW
jgi:hypothetical protein